MATSIQFPALAVVKAGPHKVPWLQSPGYMEQDMPEGHLVIVRPCKYDPVCYEVVYNHKSGWLWIVHPDSVEILEHWQD